MASLRNSKLTAFGTILILHSTYSCLHYRSLAIAANLLPDITSSPPIDVILEVWAGFILCLIGQLTYYGPFHQVRRKAIGGSALLQEDMEILRSSNGRWINNEIVAPIYRTRDFDLYNTRVRALSMAIRERKKVNNSSAS
jgi:hypothetical protein